MADARYDVFISYSSPDAVVVEQLSRSLQDAGLRVWLDTWELVPGARWKDSIEEAIRSAAATLVCIGGSGVTQSQRVEYQSAVQLETLDESKPLIPVLLPGAEPETVPSFLRARSWVDLRNGLDNRRELARLLAAVESAGRGGEIAREERTGDSLLEVEDSRMAGEHYERALRTARAAYGNEHPKVASLLAKVASTRQRLGEYADARHQLEESLRISVSVSGNNSSATASTLNNLGSVLRDMGDLMAARMYFEQALEIDRRALGPEHPTVANRLNNLGSVLRDMGDLMAARMYFEQALEIDRRALGPEHPTVAITLSNLANILAANGAKAEALRTYRDAYGMLVRIYGPDHHITQAVQDNLEKAERVLP